uniref:Uncharacterized protein n=1 Tax=Leersia perrieri TaxID=77586 RepID=A0A0D9W6A8_9ORYZ
MARGCRGNKDDRGGHWRSGGAGTTWWAGGKGTGLASCNAGLGDDTRGGQGPTQMERRWHETDVGEDDYTASRWAWWSDGVARNIKISHIGDEFRKVLVLRKTCLLPANSEISRPTPGSRSWQRPYETIFP